MTAMGDNLTDMAPPVASSHRSLGRPYSILWIIRIFSAGTATFKRWSWIAGGGGVPGGVHSSAVNHAYQFWIISFCFFGGCVLDARWSK